MFSVGTSKINESSYVDSKLTKYFVTILHFQNGRRPAERPERLDGGGRRPVDAGDARSRVPSSLLARLSSSLTRPLLHGARLPVASLAPLVHADVRHVDRLDRRLLLRHGLDDHHRRYAGADRRDIIRLVVRSSIRLIIH